MAERIIEEPPSATPRPSEAEPRTEAAPRPTAHVPGGVLPGTQSLAPRVGETVEGVVTAVRDKTIVPAQRAARSLGLVLLASIVSLSILIVFVIAAVRGLAILTGRAWIAEFIMAGIFLATGALLWRLRRPR